MDENDPIQTEHDLRHWLVNEDWYMSQHTREWLERTPPTEAADLLARLAAGANPETRGPWTKMLSDFAGVLLLPSGNVTGKGPNVRKAGLRAALMLADLNDARCLAPLARSFEIDPEKQSKYQKLITPPLTRFLQAGARHPHSKPATDAEAASAAAPDVRALVERIWNFGGLKRDLPRTFADILVLALDFLHQQGGEPNAALVRAIAEAGLKDAERVPGRARIQQTARHYVLPPA